MSALLWLLHAYGMLWAVFLTAVAPLVLTACIWEVGARCERRARR